MFADFNGHDRFFIEEQETGEIDFTLVSCFDWNTQEWDTIYGRIPKNDFLEAAKEFLEKGTGERGRLILKKTKEGIYISLKESPDFSAYRWDSINWIIVNPIHQENFVDFLVALLRAEQRN